MIPGFIKHFLNDGEQVKKITAGNLEEKESCRLVLTDRRIIVATDNIIGRGKIFYSFDYMDIKDLKVENEDHLACILAIKTSTEEIKIGITQSYINEVQNVINSHCDKRFSIAQLPINRRLISNKWSTITLLFIFLLTLPFISNKIQSSAFFDKQSEPILTEKERYDAYREWSSKVKSYWNSRENEASSMQEITMQEESNAIRINVNMQNLQESNAQSLAEFIAGNFQLNFSDRAMIVNIYSPYPHIILTKVYNATDIQNT